MPTEMFHTITELARDLGVTARTIRFYEDKGLLTPARAGTTRVYTQRDRARMILILRGKRLGFSLRDIKDYLDLYKNDAANAEQLRLLLRGAASRARLLAEQRMAIDEALRELNDIKTQAEAALAEAAQPTKRRATA